MGCTLLTVRSAMHTEQHSSHMIFSRVNKDASHFIDPSNKDLGTFLPDVQPPPHSVHCLIDMAFPVFEQPTLQPIQSCLLDDPNIDSIPPPTIVLTVCLLHSNDCSTVDKTAELTFTTSSLVFTTLQLTDTNSDSANLLQNKNDSTLIENNSSLPSLDLCVQTYFKNHKIEKSKHNLLHILRNKMIKSNFNIYYYLLCNQEIITILTNIFQSLNPTKKI